MSSARRTGEVRGADVPLAISQANLPPDAATDPDRADEMPQDKAFHTGLVRQPAEPVQERPGGAVHFESLPGAGASGFDRGSLKDLKAAHNQMEARGIPGELEHVSNDDFTDALGEAPAARGRAVAAKTATRELEAAHRDAVAEIESLRAKGSTDATERERLEARIAELEAAAAKSAPADGDAGKSGS